MRDVGHEVKRVVLLASTVTPLVKEGFLPGISVVNRPNCLAVANRQPLSIGFGGKRSLDIKTELKVSIGNAQLPEAPIQDIDTWLPRFTANVSKATTCAWKR